MEWRLEPFVLLKTRLFLSVNRVRGPFSGKGLISIGGIVSYRFLGFQGERISLFA